ncbi:hypothetical protein QEG73_21230 [Chitinophagaceae bacterium 26-R-25]|nr:hypothetical protein [Chitinophagaceae bacterium 26-R-25]
MKKLFSLVTIAASVALVSCSGGSNTKKVLIMSSGKLTVDAQNMANIKQEPGTQHNEQYVTFNTGDKVVLNVETPSGKQSFSVDAPGLYVLNLKTDTLVGGYKNFGSGPGETKITQAQLQDKVDSLQQLLSGQGVTEAKKNFFIVPGKLQKVSANTDAQIFGPFNQLPGSFSSDNDKAPEVYKFYTAPDAREVLDRTVKMLKQ